MKVCTECGQEKAEFYPRYARCKQCVREDQNATNWYKSVAMLPYEQWPAQLQEYVESRQVYVDQGHSVPAITKEMLMARSISLGTNDDDPTEVSLPLIVSLHRRIKKLEEEVAKLQSSKQSNGESAHRYMVGELNNLYRSVCKEVDTAVADGMIDPMDGADIKEGVRLINQAIVHRRSIPATGILNCVLTLAQLQLPLPPSLETLYTKFYLPQLPSAAEADIQRVRDVAGVNLYEADWEEFLQS